MKKALERFRWVVPLAAVSLIATACGGDDEGSSSDDQTDSAASGDWEPEYADGVLQPLPDGFPSEDLSFIVADEAGSDDGIYARHLAAAVSAVAPVDVQVVDRPDFGSGFGAWEVLKFMESEEAGNEGYSLAITSHTGTVGDLLSSPVASELDVGVEDLNWVITTEEVPWVILSAADRPWGNDINALIDYAHENPGELKYLSRGPGSSISVAMEHYFSELDMEVNEVVTGSPQEITIALGAGAGDFGISLTGNSLPFIQEGKVELLACTGTAPCAGDWDHDPPGMGTVAGISPDPWGSRRGLYVSRQVPDLHLQWLYEAISQAITNPDFIEQRTALPGLVLVDEDPAASRDISQAVFEATCNVLTKIGGLDPSVDC